MVAARTDRLHRDRQIPGTVETPASHDPERAWIDADRRRRQYGRGTRSARGERHRANLRFWHQRRSDSPAEGRD